jgi:peptidoglycan/xylan/chitin deacetylase (PgdA/CDA1 family)
MGELSGFALRMNPWRPSPLLYASAAVHASAAAWALLRPQSWPSALALLVANHAVLAGAGLWPRSTLLGSNWTRLPGTDGTAVAITIDDGPDPDITPQVLSLLQRKGARATFFCIGERVLKHADLARDIIRHGHTIENHSQRHRHNFSLLGYSGMRDEILRAQDSIETVTGERPRFFRAPAGLRNPFLDPVLTHLGLQLASWTRRGFDTVNSDPAAVYRRLAVPLKAGDILLLHDGNAARDRGGAPVILTVLEQLLETLEQRSLRSVTLRSALT